MGRLRASTARSFLLEGGECDGGPASGFRRQPYPRQSRKSRKMQSTSSAGNVATLLQEHASRLSSASKEDHWQWMDRHPISKRDANKFLLLSMIDFHWKSESASRRAREFAEIELGDPDDLWKAIVEIPSPEWNRRNGSRSLHSTSRRHAKVRHMAETLLSEYDGDARRLWGDRSASGTLQRLETLGLGPQLSRMTVGALLDEEEIDGSGDVKPDLHLKRVLGRTLDGREFSEREVLVATRSMAPTNPWSLDWPSWHIGRTWCHSTAPRCEPCPLNRECAYHRNAGRPNLSSD